MHNVQNESRPLVTAQSLYSHRQSSVSVSRFDDSDAGELVVLVVVVRSSDEKS